MERMRRGLFRRCALLCALALALCPAAWAEEEQTDLLTVDHRLYELGYRDGACTGTLDEVMVNALRNFQIANGLGVTGEPDAGTVLVLLSDSARGQADYLAQLSEEYAHMSALSVGSYGQSVVRVQQTLQELGYFTGTIDGNFGADSEEAVERFQLANGLEVTGTADAAVFDRLYSGTPIAWEDFLASSVAGQGDSGDRVRQLQRWLRRRGYFEGDDTARFGEETRRAVCAFQADAGLEVSGEADLQTCRALFGDVAGLMRDAAMPRRGMPGAQEMCALLQGLGYAAHDGFDMQTELALMRFQEASNLPVTGEADAATMERLRAGDAARCDDGRAGGLEAAQTEDFGARVANCAARLLGEVSGFEEEFDLVRYVYLRCGVLAPDRDLFAQVGDRLEEARPGDMMVIELESGERTGIVADDGGLIYRDVSSRIVQGYPRLMGLISVRIYRLR